MKASRLAIALTAACLLASAAPGRAADDAAPRGPLLPSPVARSAFVGYTTAPAKVGPFEIPLTVRNHSDVGGRRYASCGVPLMVGQAKEASELRLAVRNDAGQLAAVPAQFRTLARWWRADNSIRWVLVDTQTDVRPKGESTLYLTNAKLAVPAPLARLTVEQTDEAIGVSTGAARFVINRKAFNLLDRVYVREAGSKLILAGSVGGVTEDRFGNRYLASAGTRSVEVIEQGPMRVRVRARGRHVNPEGKGYSPGLYGYDVFMDFHAGSAGVFIDYIITNTPPTSQGSPTIEDASVTLKLAERPLSCAFSPGKAGHAGELAGGESLCLYQDSNGADTWNKCPGFGHMHSNGWTYPEGRLTSFRGYRLYKRTTDRQRTTTQPDDGGDVVGQGDHAGGLAKAWGERGGVLVNVRNFWRLFPKALEVCGDGTLRIGLLPRETKVVHFLEDASAAGTEIVLRFFAGRAPSDEAAWAGRWDSRVMLRPSIRHLADCGALADTGPFTVPVRGLDSTPGSKTAVFHSRMFTTDRLYGNAFGWQIFGDRWRSNGGHGRRGARQPISEDNYLWRWYVTGLPQWLAIGDARSRHFRDVRIYRVDEQDPFGFADWKAFRVANRNEDWTRRPQPKDEEYARFSQGRWSRSPWLFPNPEHTTLDLLYDRYLLLGDIRCLENMRVAAAHGGYFSGRGGSALAGGWPWRANGWGWRALERYWDLTGDAAAEACLLDVIETHAAHIGKAPLVSHHDVKKEQINWWFTNIYSRAVAMTALHTAEPRMLRLAKTLAQGKETDAGRVPTLFAVLYHLTGEKKYKEAVLGEGNGGRLLNVGGYWPACDHWLLHQPPKANND